MSNNAFIAGVKPGGLTNDYEVKILICYIMSIVKTPLTLDDINYILSSDGIANYFECSQSISDLLQHGQIGEKGDEGYVLIDDAEKIVETFYKTIPISVREKSLNNALKYVKYKNFDKHNVVTTQKVKDGYNITLNVRDNDSNLMELSLFAPDLKFCDIIKNQFYENPAQIYKAIISLLTDDIDGVYSVLTEKVLKKNNY